MVLKSGAGRPVRRINDGRVRQIFLPSAYYRPLVSSVLVLFPSLFAAGRRIGSTQRSVCCNEKFGVVIAQCNVHRIECCFYRFASGCRRIFAVSDYVGFLLQSFPQFCRAPTIECPAGDKARNLFG